MDCLEQIESAELKIIRLEQTVDFTALHSISPSRYPFLLESSAQAEDVLCANITSASEHARYDILFAFPQQSLTLFSDKEINGENVDTSKDFLSNLDSHWLQNRKNIKLSELPFSGGWFVYLGYELAGEIEPRLKLPCAQSKSIVARLTRIPLALINDKQTGCQYIVTEDEYKNNIDIVLEDIASLPDKLTDERQTRIELSEEDPQVYLDSISRIKHYIKEGDVFQVNLSRLWKAANAENLSPLTLYRSLKQTNPAPFSGCAVYEELEIISSSPERLVKTRDGTIYTRPIAGTRARNNETTADIENLKELIAHPKERAEHIMLIDLERNDLGRVCVPGSIHVDELMALESFQHVHHIVSNVTGKLKPGTTPGEVIRAVFPGGTITGCPKERCMQIIAELEGQPRGAYTGSIGYINHDGSMDLNILIRTFEYHAGELRMRAGAGLVNDSIAENELQETRAKAKGLLQAVN